MTGKQDCSESENSYALTRSQALICLGQQLDPDRPLYNMVFSFRFNTAINYRLFKRAFEHVVRHNDGLRSLFDMSSARARQYVASHLEFEFMDVDFTDHCEPESVAASWIANRKLLKLDLSRCAFDSALLRLGNNHYIWYLNQHHLITDVWSTSLVYESVLQVYQAYMDNKPPAQIQRPSIVDYHRFEAENRLQLEESVSSEIDSLAQVKPVFYGTEFNPGEGHTTRFSRSISDSLANSIDSLAQLKSIATISPQLTRFNIYMTVLCAYLARTTNLSTITIGVPVHNRMQRLHQQTIGLFIELFPMTIELDDQMSFLSLYEQVAVKSQKLLENAGPGQSQANTARRYNIILNFINAQFGSVGSELDQVQWVHCDYCDPAHMLRVHVCQFTNTQPLELIIDIATQLYDNSTRPDITGHFIRLLQAFVNQPQQRISSALMSSTDESRWLLNQYNPALDQTLQQDTSSVLELFRKVVNASPHRCALVHGERRYSFNELDQWSDSLARQLQIKGVRQTDLVAVHMQRSAELIVAMLAVLKSAAAFIPLEESLPQQRIDYILRQSGARLVIGQPALLDKFENRHVSTISVELDSLQPITAEKFQCPTLDPTQHLAYVMYTSGSTGQPKGVMINHRSLHDYVSWAISQYTDNQALGFALYSSIGFDLTLTSIFVPLCSGGTIHIYQPESSQVDASIIDVFEDNQVDIVKLTPAHLSLVLNLNLEKSRITAFILGGDDLKVALAKRLVEKLPEPIRLFNEYGPTEATVGCMIHEFDANTDGRYSASVPIGTPALHSRIYLLDDELNPVPAGVEGEIYIAGSGLSSGYLNDPGLTSQAFMADPFVTGQRMYKTNDLARMLPSNKLVYLSRKDDQFKFHGIRIEKAEIEQALIRHDLISDCHVVKHSAQNPEEQELVYCERCGIASNYPDIKFDHHRVCNICQDFASYHDKAGEYFGSLNQLKVIISELALHKTGRYDCMMLYSGGKDSTYALYKLSQMGYSVYAMTLDNGFISASAKVNITRTVEELGIDHVFASTTHMNDIFVDSLKRHCSVCYGCFKTIYTLAMKIAREKGITCIVTGLSRGQFFETRLTKESFIQHNFDPKKIDQDVLAARKTYHKVNDIVTQRLADGLFDDEQIFSQIQFVDFYRYCDVSLTEIYQFLENRVPWVRPQDTGRSTNCTINDTGIQYHKTRQGYHNYALPYSWDVRLGLKTKEQAMDELNDEIDISQVRQNLQKIGFDVDGLDGSFTDEALVAYYVSDKKIPAKSLRQFLTSQLSARIIPNHLVHMSELPLTDNGKIDQDRLADPFDQPREIEQAITAASNPQENALVTIFSQVLHQKKIGINDNYFDLGGDSIKAIQIAASANQIGITLKPAQLFDYQTIAELARVVKQQMPDPGWQKQISGQAPLTPIQKWFFTQPIDSRNQFSHRLVIALKHKYSTKQLSTAIGRLIDHHDVLRHCFKKSVNQWRQVAMPDTPGFVFKTIDTTASELPQHINHLESQLSSQLDIEKGQLVACAHLRLIDDANDELVIVIHHLAIDAVSWAIFLEDLDLLLKQLILNQTLLMPFKTSAFLDWANALDGFEVKPETAKNLPDISRYHAVIIDEPDQSLTMPANLGTTDLNIPMASLEPLQNTKINNVMVGLQDWVLAALARTLSAYSKQNAICINVESHGRQDISSAVNINRTMGWFTSLNPVCLDLNQARTPEELIELIHQQQESALFRFLLQSRQAQSELAPQLNSGVLFNFLGRYTDHFFQNFKISQRLKLIRANTATIQHGFEINVFEVADQLKIEWSYDCRRFSVETITRLLDEVENQLLSFSTAKDMNQKPTPTYSLTGLDDDELAAISSQLK